MCLKFKKKEELYIHIKYDNEYAKRDGQKTFECILDGKYIF